MKVKTHSGVIIARHPIHLSEPTRRFLRGLLVLILALGSLIALAARGQSNYPAPYYFNTFAGNAYGGNGPGSRAIFNFPQATAVDGAGNLYVADSYNYTVRKITAAGVVTKSGNVVRSKNFNRLEIFRELRSEFPGLGSEEHNLLK